jgi:hypothetical protein
MKNQLSSGIGSIGAQEDHSGSSKNEWSDLRIQNFRVQEYEV